MTVGAKIPATVIEFLTVAGKSGPTVTKSVTVGKSVRGRKASEGDVVLELKRLTYIAQEVLQLNIDVKFLH